MVQINHSVSVSKVTGSRQRSLLTFLQSSTLQEKILKHKLLTIPKIWDILRCQGSRFGFSIIQQSKTVELMQNQSGGNKSGKLSHLCPFADSLLLSHIELGAALYIQAYSQTHWLNMCKACFVLQWPPPPGFSNHILDIQSTSNGTKLCLIAIIIILLLLYLRVLTFCAIAATNKLCKVLCSIPSAFRIRQR